MKSFRKPIKPLWVHAQILQNGYPVASCKKKVSRRGGMTLTSGRGGDLRIPFYSSQLQLNFVKFKSGVINFKLDLPWDGQLSSEGLVQEIDRNSDRTATYTLINGDFVSLSHGDLRILVQILDRPDLGPRPAAIKPVTGYRDSWLSFFIQDKTTLAASGIGVLAALILVSAFSMGLNARKVAKISQFEQLDASYVLPFVDPEHLRLAPESLQENLDTKHFLTSILLQYRSFTDMLSGLEKPAKDFVYVSSQERFARAHEEQDLQISRLRGEMLESAKNIRNKSNAGTILIPMVFGESSQETISRVVTNLNTHHEALNEVLSMRRQTLEQFNKDPEYDYKEYKKLPKVNEKAQEALKKIKVWNMPTEEEALYIEATRLANAAKTQGKAYRSIINLHGRDDPLAAPIEIESSKKLFSPNLVFDNTSEYKLSLVRASEYGQPKQKVIKEPLTGEIESHLVDRTIQKNQFDLQLCFETALRRNQLTEGTMEWKWRIDTRGTIEDLELLTSTIKDQRMIRCVKQKISSWQFPRPRRGSVEIIYPFTFKPARG